MRDSGKRAWVLSQGMARRGYKGEMREPELHIDRVYTDFRAAMLATVSWAWQIDISDRCRLKSESELSPDAKLFSVLEEVELQSSDDVATDND